MVQQDKESNLPHTIRKLVADRDAIDALRDLAFFPESERAKLVSDDMLRTMAEPYTAIEDSHIKVIDIKRSVTRESRWEKFLYEYLHRLNDIISKLQDKIQEISASLQVKTEVYNATIYELNNPKYSITTPIQILIIDDDDTVVARMPELNLYASGDTDTEAIYELKQEIISLYEDLSTSENQLGPLPKSWLNTLNKLIVVTDG